MSLGRRGDGIADVDGHRVFVPHALPGERIEAEIRGSRGRLIEVLQAAPERVPPPCSLFGQCGGCAVQHLAQAEYRDWKRGIVVTALANKGLDAPVAELVDAHGAGRRRVALHVRFEGGRARVGFMQARAERLLDIDRCHVLAPPLHDATAIARRLAGPFTARAKGLDIKLTATDTGLDVVVLGAGRLDYDMRAELADLAQADDLARLGVDGELVCERRRPSVRMSGIAVTPPAGGFLQATLAGERVLTDLVSEHVSGTGRVADLFCGVGPFGLHLARKHAVHAVDGDPAALAALDQAVRHADGLKPVDIEKRDLFENPLGGDDLDGVETVIFDPPRAGAQAQATELAASAVPTVIAVSCEPATFARDSAILTTGGYVLESVVPVDQFRFAAHVEVVGLFRRPPKRQ